MHKFQLSHAVLLALVELAKDGAAQVESFISDPEATISRWAATVGLEIELIPDDTEGAEHPIVMFFDSLLSPYMDRMVQLRDEMIAAAVPAPASSAVVPLSAAAPYDQTQLRPLPSHLQPVRRATPQEKKGYEELLQGRKGRVLRLAGPNSWLVQLEDAYELVLPTHALEFAGCEAPKMPIEHITDERVAGWQEVIQGRRGSVLRAAGPGSYVVRFDDGNEAILPAAALPHAGCEAPRLNS
jgi:hypothetical protein